MKTNDLGAIYLAQLRHIQSQERYWKQLSDNGRRALICAWKARWKDCVREGLAAAARAIAEGAEAREVGS